MVGLTSRRARWLATLLIDGTFVLAFLWPSRGGGCTFLVPLSQHPVRSTGRLLRELAFAQQLYRETHAEYATRVAALTPPLLGWDIVILDASASSYRMRISNRSDTCEVWGSRGYPNRMQPFYVNCGLQFSSPDAG